MTEQPTNTPPAKSSTLRSAALMSAGTLLSRILGLVRDMLTATFFGAGAAVDAFFIAFMLPNLFRKLFGEGALSSATIPVLTEYKERRSHSEQQSLISSLMTGQVFFLSVLTLLACAFIWIVPGQWLGFGNDGQKWSLFQHYFILLFPLLIFVCIAALQSSVLNTYGRFGIAAITPAIQNVIWIGGILISVYAFPALTLEERLSIVSVSILIGGIVQVMHQHFELRKLGFHLRPRFTPRDPGVTAIRGAMLPTLLPIAMFQINTLMDMVLAEWLVPGDGAVSAYGYASRLYQFPFGIVGIALATAVFPMLARYASRGEDEKVTGALLNGLRLLAFISFPAAAGMLVLNDEIVASVYVRGEFTPEAAGRSARVLWYFSLALPVVCALQIITKAFYALKDMRTPVIVSMLSVAVNLVANLILVRTELREAGLSAGTAISSLFGLVVLSVILRRKLRGSIIESGRLDSVGPPSDRLAQPMSPSMVRAFWLSVSRSALFSIVMAAAVLALINMLPAVSRGDFQGVALTLIGIGAGMMVYIGLNLVFGRRELRELLKSSS